MKLHKIAHRNLLFVLLAVLVTILYLSFYTALQTSIRHAANDPQIQMVEDAVNRLSQGTPLSEVVPITSVDMSASLSTFLNIYDRIGTPINGSGTLHSALPKIPSKVFEQAEKTGQHRLRWQPEKNVRIALVIQTYGNKNADGGFVVAGRSLKEIDRRITTIGFMLLGAWIISLACIAGAWFFRRTFAMVE